MRKTVLIVQRRLTHYRVPFFQALREEMRSRNLELLLACGEPTEVEAGKRDGGELSWAYPLKTVYMLGGRVCWQPFAALARRSDLVVLTHENKLICNLWAQYGLRDKRVALWGHGANLQGDQASRRERFKQRTAVRADWWFGYTEMSRPLVLQSGFPADRVTVVENAIDTIALREHYESASPGAVALLRKQLGLVGGHVGVFVGSLYSDKRIGFLLDAAKEVRRQLPDFELVMAGAGPEKGIVEAFCCAHPWAHYVGPVEGMEKARLLALAKVVLNPGLVGLGILDSFVCKVPMVTTDFGRHSPEIAYLDNGVNGVMARDAMADYVDAAVKVLCDHPYREGLVLGCAASARRYSIENMARNFTDGIISCFTVPIQRRRL